MKTNTISSEQVHARLCKRLTRYAKEGSRWWVSLDYLSKKRVFGCVYRCLRSSTDPELQILAKTVLEKIVAEEQRVFEGNVVVTLKTDYHTPTFRVRAGSTGVMVQHDANASLVKFPRTCRLIENKHLIATNSEVFLWAINPSSSVNDKLQYIMQEFRVITIENGDNIGIINVIRELMKSGRATKKDRIMGLNLISTIPDSYAKETLQMLKDQPQYFELRSVINAALEQARKQAKRIRALSLD